MVSIFKRVATAVIVTVALLSLTCACSAQDSEPSMLSICASTEEKEDVFRVYAGDVDKAPEGYTQIRAEYLDSTADTGESVEALICLNDYYTAQEVTALAKDYNAVIDRAYMWPEGETGRLLLFVEDGDLDASVESYKSQIAENNSRDDPEVLKDYQSFMDGKFGVFAIVVTAPTKTLNDMRLNLDCISFIDVLYNEEAEAYAEKKGKPVSYIEMPSKPDGAL